MASRRLFDGAQQEIGSLPAVYTGSTATKVWIKVAGVWKEATPYIRVGGIWKVATPKIRAASVWR
jgi:hypothetical protein